MNDIHTVEGFKRFLNGETEPANESDSYRWNLAFGSESDRGLKRRVKSLSEESGVSMAQIGRIAFRNFLNEVEEN